MRQPAPRTFVPDTVVSPTNGNVITIKGNAVLTAITVAIAEDFHAPTRGGAPDIVSAANDAMATLAVIKAAGLRIIDADPDATLPVDYDGEDADAPTHSVHCFFQCPHVERSDNLREARAAMQEHYSADHAESLSTFLGRAVDRPAPERPR